MHSHDTNLPLFYFFFFYCYRAHRDLHSFPTRRSSDLVAREFLSCRVIQNQCRIHSGINFPGLALDQNALRSEEHTSELQSRVDLVCRLLLEKKKKKKKKHHWAHIMNKTQMRT